MNKFAKDPGLNEIAVKLKTLPWTEVLTREEEDSLNTSANMLPSEFGAKRRCVAPFPNFRDWSVRLYLGGEQRTIGIVNTELIPNALRYADMAQMYFWKYRVRGACPPTENQLNRAKADVEHDMIFETDAVALLKQTEAYMLERGYIKTADQRKQEKKAKQVQSVRVLQGVFQAEIMEQFDGVHTQLGELAKSLAAVPGMQQHDEMAKRLAAIESSHALIVEALQAIARQTKERGLKTSE